MSAAPRGLIWDWDGMQGWVNDIFSVWGGICIGFCLVQVGSNHFVSTWTAENRYKEKLAFCLLSCLAGRPMTAW